jgi:tryptophan synthase alpha chain
MSLISDYIQEINDRNEKALSVFLTAGFPDKNGFVQLALNALDAGADILEIGIPFSDPMADGPVIQHSSQTAIENGTTIADVFTFTKAIRAHTHKPLIAMTYANILLHYGVDKFLTDAKRAGFNGVIIPDLSVEEYHNFVPANNPLDIIMLASPTTSDERLEKIDELSKGFVYFVSVTGTTGVQQNFNEEILDKIKHARTIIKNKMLIGFGISKPSDIKLFSPYADGMIVGSAVIKELHKKENNYTSTIELIRTLKTVCITV